MFLKLPQIKILIIENNSNNIPLLEAELNNLNIHGVKKTPDFDHAETLLEKTPFHLAVVCGEDQVTPDTAYDLFADRQNLRTLPKILFNSSCELGVPDALQSAGFIGCIPNPPTRETTLHALKNFLKQKNRQDLNQSIKNSPFFEEFLDSDFRELVKIATPKIFDVGDIIVKPGELARSFFILVRGKVEALSTKNNVPIAHFPIEQGEPFGELAIIDNSPRSAFCVAVDQTLALEIDDEAYKSASTPLQVKMMTKIAFFLAQRMKQVFAQVDPAENPSPYLNELFDMVMQNIGAKDEEQKVEKASAPLSSEEELPQENDDLREIKKMIMEEKAEGEQEEVAEQNPFAKPTGTALEVLTTITDDQYEVLTKKIHLRTAFILKKIPASIIDIIRNKLFGYWTGGKLAKYNPHYIWPEEFFNPGSPRLKRALHLVVACPEGESIYEKAYLKIPFSQKIIGFPETGFAGTFLGSEESIARYLDGECLTKALAQDLNLPIDRLWKKKECIEYLTHTMMDVRDETLFLIFDSPQGELTHQFRQNFPQNQMLTVIRNYQFDMENLATMFTQTEETLKEEGLLVPKNAFKGEGFYQGETLFLPDMSAFYSGNRILKMSGYIFGLIGLLSQIGPDYSGMIWGSSGGAEGAVRAAKALFGMKGAQNSEDLANAVNWADN